MYFLPNRTLQKIISCPVQTPAGGPNDAGPLDGPISSNIHPKQPSLFHAVVHDDTKDQTNVIT